MDNDRKIPNIRFAGFTDTWEQRKLSDVAEIVGGGTPSTSNDEYWDGDIDWYTPAEINNQIFVDNSERKITELGLQKSSAKILPADKTVLFTSRAGIGKIAILRHQGTTNQGFQSLVLNDKTNTYFVFSMGSKIKESAERIASGSTFAEISGKMLGNLEFMFPNEDEQRKIGEYFQSIDNLITLHQREYDLLVKTKKSYLRKMFPQNGEDKPELRFSGFTNAWEQRKLGEVLKTESFRPYLKEPEADGKYKIIQQGDNPLVGYANGEPYRDYKKIVLFGDHTLSLYKPKSPFFISTDGVKLLYGTNNLYGNFLLYLLENYKPKTEGYKRYYSILKDQYGYLPSNINEQQKIGVFFMKLDNLITLHQRELNSLKDIKKSLLQQMFV